MPAGSRYSGNDFLLAQRDIHVWAITQPALPLACPPVLMDKYTSLLSPDEQAKAGAFKFEKDKVQSILSRGTLRYLLGKYLGAGPRTLTFNYNKAGKPSLAALGFNVSHSQRKILIALAREQELGIDIEYKKPLSDLDSMARFVMTDNEKNEFDTVPADLRPFFFYEYWARKEAYIKAIGEGLSCSLKEPEFRLVPGNKLELACINNEQRAFCDWSVIPLTIAGDYAAAIVVREKGWQVTVREWEIDSIEA